LKIKDWKIINLWKKLQCRSKFFWEVKVVGHFFLKRGKKKSAIIVTKLGYHVKESWHEE